MRSTALLFVLPLLAACDLDLTGLGGGFDLNCFGCYEAPGHAVLGKVWIGDYAAESTEAVVELYAEGDLATPVDSIYIRGSGEYYKDFGDEQPDRVCNYVARARLWTGVRTDPERLFSGPDACVLSTNFKDGATFDLPAYEPLDEPFVVWASTWIDGRRARSGETEIRALMRRRRGEQRVAEWLPSNASGQVRIETTNAAERFSLCRYVHFPIRVTARGPSGATGGTRLDPPSSGRCGNSRRMHEMRFGSLTAASGRVHDGPVDVPGTRAVGPNQATVSLASPADSSIIGEVFKTYDDGTFTVYFPYRTSDRECALLLRIEYRGAVQYRPRGVRSSYGCDQTHVVEFGSG